MNARPLRVHSLCPECSECPTVEIYDDGSVRIGESPNQLTLRGAEWNELVKAVRNGQLGETGD